MMEKVTLTHVGSSASKYLLELRGRVLIVQFRSWVGHATSYVPVEHVRVEHSTKRNGRMSLRSWAGLVVMIPMIALIVLGVRLYSAENVDLSNNLFGGLLIPFVFVLLFAIGATLRFLIWPQPTVQFHVDTDNSAYTLEFFRPAKQAAELDRMVQQLQAFDRDGDDGALLPTQLSFTLQHVKPLRMTVARSLSLTVLLGLLLAFILFFRERYTGNHYTISPMLFSVLLIPSIWFFFGYGIQRYWLSKEPAPFRDAVRHMWREEFADAERALRQTLEQHPEHEPAHRLLTQVLAQRGDFDGAFAACAQLARFQPEEAEELQSDLWALKRITARMDA